MDINNNSEGYAGKIVIISGWRNVGKTSFCRKMCSICLNEGLLVKGVLSPSRFENGNKTGIYALDLSGGEPRL
ncbi:MAG: hypothetical protein LWX83_17625, partial [Anaerolineae bacterium]|nr:hypothetical protein [Anaerolineae bacterium]